jgi:hypothetical protein
VSLTSSGGKNSDQKPFRTSKDDAPTHDIIDNLHVPREQVLQQRNRPLLESFGKDSVIGEEECVGDDLPGFVPRNLLLIDQNTHEFWDSESGVGIVELDGSI